jgi:hypothetical protein
MDQVNNIINTPKDSLAEYEHLLELLRARLNVLNASIFLLEDNLNNVDNKTHEYIKKINAELERIRQLIIKVPKYIQSE